MIAMRVKMAIIEHLPEIIRESVKPMEAIEGIKILQVEGLNTGGADGVAGGTDSAARGDANLAEQVVNAALRYRGQAPLLDAILKEIGITGGDIKGFTSPIRPEPEKKDKTSTKK